MSPPLRKKPTLATSLEMKFDIPSTFKGWHRDVQPGAIFYDFALHIKPNIHKSDFDQKPNLNQISQKYAP